MPEVPKSLVTVLSVPEAKRLQEVIAEKGRSPVLDGLDDPARALRFLRANVCGSYLFARFATPSYAAAVFQSLTKMPPVDDELGRILSSIVDAVRGELFNNNIFDRAGECHSHFYDAFEAYASAGGDVSQVRAFLDAERRHGFARAAAESELWGAGAVRHAHAMLACCRDPLALFVLMPANEDLTPRIYARALGSLSKEARFDAFRRFLERHVALDEDDHGPAALEWLDLYVRRMGIEPARLSAATELVLRLYEPQRPKTA